MKYYFFILFSFGIILISCNEKNSKNSITHKLEDKYIFAEISKKIGIKQLKNSDMPLEVRIWGFSSPVLPTYLIYVSQNTQKEMTLRVYFLNPEIKNQDSFSLAYKDIDKQLFFISFDNMQVKELQNKPDPELFSGKLDSLGIEILPEQIETLSPSAKGEDIEGGIGYFIEIKRNNFYRAFTYSNPEYYGKSEKNNKKVSDFIDNVKNCFAELVPVK